MSDRRAAKARIALHCVFVIAVIAGTLVAVTGGPDRAEALTPKPDLTPGQVSPDVTQRSLAATVCVRGFVASRSRVSESTAARVYSSYGVDGGVRDRYTLTPLIPVEVGGTTAPENLWPRLHGQGIDDSAWVAAVHRRMCRHGFPLAAARSLFPDRTTWERDLANRNEEPATTTPTTTGAPTISTPTTTSVAPPTATDAPTTTRAAPTTTRAAPTTKAAPTTTTAAPTTAAPTTAAPTTAAPTTAAPTTTAPTTTAPTTTAPRPTSSLACSGGWLTTPIPANPVLDANSASWASRFASGNRVLNAFAFSNPVYVAQPSDPRQTIVVDNEPAWGTNTLSRQAIPIPPAMVASSGTDGKLAIVDPVARKIYDLWTAHEVDGVWHAGWGGVYDLDSDCTSRHPDYLGGELWPTTPVSRSTGSGISTIGGMITLDDVRKGSIDHTLVFATDINAAGTFRFPATATDGSGAGPIPEGTRIQLDPTFVIPPMWPEYAQMIAKALQVYGAVSVDNGGCRVCLSRELPKTGDADPYPSVGMSDGYDDLWMIPWSRVRVLQSWDGS